MNAAAGVTGERLLIHNWTKSVGGHLIMNDVGE